MRLIDADAFDTILENGEIEAKKQRKYVLASALNTVRGNLAKQSSVSSNCSEIPNNWIPCSVKKHPDKDMFCHVTVIDYDGDYIVENDDWDVDSESWDEYSDDEIIAWMPEIQPYQPKEDES